MKSMHAFKRGTAVFLALAALGCASAKGKPAKTTTPIVAEVVSEPAGLEVAFQGKAVGIAPFELPLARIEDATGLTAAAQVPPTMERRIRILGPERVQVLIRVGGEPSAVARALGLTSVVVFDYGEATTFDVDRAELKPSFLPQLERQARMLNESFAGLDIFVCGHTDSTGAVDHNLALSLERAEAVSRYLLELDVEPGRLRSQGFGDEYPVASNSTPEGRARNRRTEIILPD